MLGTIYAAEAGRHFFIKCNRVPTPTQPNSPALPSNTPHPFAPVPAVVSATAGGGLLLMFLMLTNGFVIIRTSIPVYMIWWV